MSTKTDSEKPRFEGKRHVRHSDSHHLYTHTGIISEFSHNNDILGRGVLHS